MHPSPVKGAVGWEHRALPAGTASLVTTDTTWLAERKWAQGSVLLPRSRAPACPARFACVCLHRTGPASHCGVPGSQTLAPPRACCCRLLLPTPRTHSCLWRGLPSSQKQTDLPPCFLSCPVLPHDELPMWPRVEVPF